MLDFYRFATDRLEPVLGSVLNTRVRKGKEMPERIAERKGIASLPRPEGPFVLLHAASVGEAQSALILIDRILKTRPGLKILVTTGTVASAKMMQNNLPPGAVHQFAPYDHQPWVKRFLDSWNPCAVLWMESELWPNMLNEIRRRNIPAALINARLSDKTFGRWKLAQKSAREILSVFTTVLAQTQQDADRYGKLGAKNVIFTDNIKYSAAPLGFNENELKKLTDSLRGRPCWLFASTHQGEETMACRIHAKLKTEIPKVLTILVPRHPARREEIIKECKKFNLNICLRTKNNDHIPQETDMYIADTMGELGLFYRLSSIACIGRSFSDDGGGGHNPIEAAQLRCAVLSGPHTQFQHAIYNSMTNAGAAQKLENEEALSRELRHLLTDPAYLESKRNAAYAFLHDREGVIERVMKQLDPLLDRIATQQGVNP